MPRVEALVWSGPSYPNSFPSPIFPPAHGRPIGCSSRFSPTMRWQSRSPSLPGGCGASLVSRGKPIATDRLHVTSHFLGDFPGLPKDVIASASVAAASLTSRPFEVAFDRVMSFDGKPHNRPFVLRGGKGLADLTRFQGELAMAMAKSGQGRTPRANFTPHATLLYDNENFLAGRALR